MPDDVKDDREVQDALPEGTVVQIVGIPIRLLHHAEFVTSKGNWELIRRRLQGTGKTARKRAKEQS